MAMMDVAFKKIVGLFGVNAAKLNRRIPFSAKKLSPQSPQLILDKMTVATLAVDINTSNTLGDFVTSVGGKVVNDPSSENNPIDAILFDARGLKTIESLSKLHSNLNPIIGKLSKSGRLVIIGGDVNERQDVHLAAVNNGLIGFTKAIAKEIAKKGITANLISVSRDSTPPKLSGIVQFVLSNRSAYITGQTFRVSQGVTDTSTSTSTSTPESNQNKGNGFSVTDKTVVITGAARGIGEFTSRVFHAEGANILLVDHPTMTTQLKQLYEELGGAQNHKVHMLSLDVTDSNAPLGLESYIRSVFPGYGLDVMVHNAGITRDKTFANMKLENFQSVINVNINAIAKIDEVLLKSNEIGEGDSALNSVMRQGGKIVCLSSISGIAGGFGQSNYSCTKAAVMGYVSSQAHLLSARGITVNAIAPGFIETEMTKAVPYFTRNVGRIISALQQPGYPVDIAEAILFLSSDASSGMSGTTIRVCGLNLVGA